MKKAKNHEEVKNSIEEAFYKIFSKNYCEYILKLTDKSENSHWKMFVLSAAIFSFDNSRNKWILSMNEFEFDKEGLDKVINAFKKSSPKFFEMSEFLKENQAKPSNNLD